jgi:hypothetical protein
MRFLRARSLAFSAIVAASAILATVATAFADGGPIPFPK